MVVTIYKVTQDSLNRRITYGSDITCYTCGLKIKINDSVVTKKGAKQGKLIRHESCARRVGLID